MAKMKKAFFLSLTAIFLILIIALSFSIAKDIDIAESQLSATAIRISVLNSFVADMESNYFENMLYVSGKSALETMALNKDNFNLPTEDGFKLDFINILYNGTIREGNEYIIIDEGMKDKSISELIKRIESIFDGIGIKVNNVNVKIISVKHNSPWTVDIEAEFDYDLEDKFNIAAWRGAIRKEASVSIIGLTDPISDGDGAIFMEGSNRWVQHSIDSSATRGNSFLKRLSDDEALSEYGICKEDHEHCGFCNINCKDEQKLCDLNPSSETFGECV